MNWLSNVHWGSNILSDFVINIPGQVDAVASLYGMNKLWLVLLAAVFLILCLYLSFKIFFYLNQIQIFHNKKTLIYVISYISFIGFYVSISYSRNGAGEWKNEPIINLMTAQNLVFNTPISRIEAIQDYDIRAEFKKELQNSQPSTHVIIVMVDSFRADRTSVYNYDRNTTPFLKQSEAEGTMQKVDVFTSTCSESTCGIYSTFSSRRASYLGEDLYDVSDVLKDLGYRKKYILSARHDYNNLENFYSKDRDLYINGSDFDAPYLLYEDEGVIHHLNQLPKANDEPMFLYLHLMSAHQLGKNLDPFNVYQPYKEVFLGKEAKDSKDQIAIENTYDNGILQTDDYISRIFGVLQKKEYLDDAVVIIMGDHGEGLGEHHNQFAHSYYLYHENINIPFLFFSSNNSCQLENKRYGTQIDVAPTILDCLNIPVPKSWQGHSLLKPYLENRITYHQTIRDEKEVMVVMENQNHMYKLIATSKPNGLENLRLFDYYNDQSEKNNLFPDSNISSYLQQLLVNEFN